MPEFNPASIPTTSPDSETLRPLVEALSDCGVLILDPDGCVLGWNEAAQRIVEYAADEVIGRPAAMFLGRAPGGAGPDPFTIPAGSAGSSNECEALLARRSGTSFRALVAVVTTRDADGRECRIVTIRDLDRRAMAMDGFQRTVGLVGTVAHETTDAVFVKDLEGRFLFFNEAAARVVGRPVAEALGRHTSDVFEAESARHATERDQQVMSSGVASTAEEVLTAGGVTRTYLSNKAPYRDASGRVIGLIGISRDITERKEAERERAAHLHFFESMDRVNRAMQGTGDLEQMMSAVLDEVLEILQCDRAFLLHPCDPETLTWSIPVERTRPEYPGAFALGIELATNPETAESFRILLESAGPVRFGRETGQPWSQEVNERFGIKSYMSVALYPKVGKPWQFGVHQCSHPRVWSTEDVHLMREIARRLADSLTSLLTLRELQDSELRHREVFDNSSDCMLLLDVETAGHFRIVDCNAEEQGAAGFAGREVNGRLLGEVVPAPRLAQLEADCVRCIEAGRQIRFEEELATPAGNRRFDTSLIPVRDASGRVYRVARVARDITERRRAQNALQESEARLRAFFETAHVGMVESGPDGLVTRANDAFCRMTGYSLEELSRMSPAELVFPEDRGHLAQEWRELVAGQGEAYHVERRFRRKDGSALWALVHLAVMGRDASGRPTGASAVVVDLSDRRRAAGLLKSVLDSVHDAIITIDAHGVIVSVNPATEKLFGHSVDELMGRNVSMLMDESVGSAHDAHIARYLETGIARVINVGQELQQRRKDGSVFPGELTVTEFRLDDGRYFTGVIRDLSERNRLEEHLRSAQKMEAIGTLAGGIAHDFNNLLTVINGCSDLLLAHGKPVAHHRDLLVNVRNAGQQAARLTGQLLAFSRKAIVEPRVLDLNEVIDSIGKMLRRLIGEDVVMISELKPGLGRVKIDPGQVEQVIMNLAVNARDAMPRGGRLTIRTEDVLLGPGDVPDAEELVPGQHVCLTVTDTGCGMSEDVQARIFEPFFTTKGPGVGTGLGLAMVYGIARQAGGYVGVRSRVGEGTTFSVWLPTVPEPVPAPASRDAGLAPRGTETILLAEDEAGVRKLARLVLEMQGYTVIESSSGSDALAASEAFAGTIHLLLTDVVMADLDGRGLVDALRPRRPDVKVLYMSGYSDEAIVLHGVSGAWDAFLQKPFTPLGLARKVRAVLDGSVP